MSWRRPDAAACRSASTRARPPSSRRWRGGLPAPARVRRRVLPQCRRGGALTGATEPEAQLDVLRRRYRTVVIKRGALGAVAADGAERFAAPAVTAAVVDTTGAGDAFLAGFLAARLGGAGLAQSLARGCTLGALATTTAGGRPAAESACNAPGPMPI
ncbi:MAG: hypothetical protein IRY94_07695 [Rhodospirillaceae bacterium]|nr:hypothetical protein [Rhodospirillaceae bacterium]